jgi:hypothetical protein
MVQYGYHYTAFYEILSSAFLLKSFDQSQVWLKSVKNDGHFAEYVHCFMMTSHHL